MPKVLIVEDFLPYYENIRIELGNRAEVLWGQTLEEGEKIFENNPDLDLIIMDACVPGQIPNAMPLVKKIIATGFKNPIIACSSMFCMELLEAGATHEANKYDAAKLAIELLGI